MDTKKNGAGLIVGGLGSFIVGLIIFVVSLSIWYGEDLAKGRYNSGGQSVSMAIFVGILIGVAGLIMLLVGMYKRMK